MTLLYLVVHFRIGRRNYGSYKDSPLKPEAMITSAVFVRFCLLLWTVPLAVFAVTMATCVSSGLWLARR